MDKRDFENKLKNKQIRECVSILRKEIIEILTKKVQEKDRYFKYSTTSDLKNKAGKHLDLMYSEISNRLYQFDIMYELDEYKLDEMLDMYKKLSE